MTSLYQLTAEYQAIAERLHDSDLDDQTIADTLEGMSGDIETKIQNVGFVIRNEEAEAEMIEQAIDAMSKRMKSKRNHVQRLKSYVLGSMIATGTNKVESPWFVLSIRNNPESVVIDAESQLPQEYMREVPASYSPDKTLIKKAIQDGFTVPGAHLTRTQSLSIK